MEMHGKTNHPLYQTWVSMRKRCRWTGHHAYHNYGGRGIEVCTRWDESFTAFLEDMGEKPSPSHSLDRIDNSGNYSPENCKWVTWKEQQNNRRDNIALEIDGEFKSIPEWARESGVAEVTIRNRIRLGWPPKEAVFKQSSHEKAKIIWNGEKWGVSELARKHGLHPNTFRRRYYLQIKKKKVGEK